MEKLYQSTLRSYGIEMLVDAVKLVFCPLPVHSFNHSLHTSQGFWRGCWSPIASSVNHPLPPFLGFQFWICSLEKVDRNKKGCQAQRLFTSWWCSLKVTSLETGLLTPLAFSVGFRNLDIARGGGLRNTVGVQNTIPEQPVEKSKQSITSPKPTYLKKNWRLKILI